MSVRRVLSAWRADPDVGGNLAAARTLPGKPPAFQPFPNDMHPALQQALQRSGIQALYAHQRLAWEHARLGHSLVVVTGTASGKTLCYNLPVLDRLLRDPQARALYLFPTRALAQDQLMGLRELAGAADRLYADREGRSAELAIAVYDGDTPAAARPAIRKNARIVLSNPDMLHTGILPHHTAWAEFFQGLQYVVVDEMHAYRGVFGSHVANVIRRLKRVARFYGSAPQFVLTSATIGNPAELAARLVEQPAALVDEDGAGRGPRQFLIFNPPVIDRDLGLRKSAIQEGARLADDLLAYGVQTIVFARTRRTVELLLTYLRQRAASPGFTASSSRLPAKAGGEERNDRTVRGYRSGYLPGQRREIEAGLRQGDVRAVVATSALELGIDIGSMGASVLVGYPGTIAATWQQAGRAGRGEEEALSVLVATADPLDQFLAAHPEYFFGRSPEQALINPDNLLILLSHLRCAAFELPFQPGESFGQVPAEQVAEFLDFLSQQGVLHRSASRYFWMADKYPAQDVSLRSAGAGSVLLQTFTADGPFTLGEVDEGSATWMVHPQAIYLHEGQSYLVESLDLDNHLAQLRRLDSDYYTQPSTETTVALLEQNAGAPVPGGSKAYGEITVTNQLVGFKKVKWYTHEQLGMEPLQMPPSTLQTTGYWLSLADETVERLRAQGLWANDPNDYGPGWSSLRDLVRQRDGYRCQSCGAEETWRQHDVHHKTPFRAFASAEQANQISNLVTLCHACHRKVETAVRVRSGLAGLAYVLGHLAPFFLMCDTRDLGVHSDPLSPLAGGKPAVVLYDEVPAGIGFSERLYELHAELAQRALELVRGCACTDGCPSCVGPGGENGYGGKRETLAILEALAGGHPGKVNEI